MLKKFLILILHLSFFAASHSQELFVFTEPASNPPARSMSIKASLINLPTNVGYDRPAIRISSEIRVGLSKNWMVALLGSASNMHTYDFRAESLTFFTKYRFLAHDEVHRHFRMAVFLQGSYTQAPFHYDEISLRGDRSGIEAGLIATQLLNRFALSSNISNVQVLDRSRNSETVFVPPRIYQAMNYSLSSGYSLFPKVYKSYRQLGVNLYLEFLAQQTLDISRYYIDAAPAIQLVLFGHTKINAGYRFQLAGNESRVAKMSLQFSIDTLLLNIWKRNLNI